ncbi:IgGFc-binding protein-like, partial [Diadema antillarum]|uniref:IgGFc-binding protein-like n=1 Tax=Diadema antillarum TaxID=105358 RepID=UPI003A8A7051
GQSCVGVSCQFGECVEGRCVCLAGYTGESCTLETDECASDPCQNNGTCTDGFDAFVCTCPQGYGGDICQNETGPCLSNPCQNGICTNQFSGGGDFYTCSCFAGWEGDDCDEDINECIVLGFPCQNGAECINLENDYLCNCTSGWTGRNCTEDFDECSSFPCENGGTCSNLQGAFNCTCPIAWEGSQCEIERNACVDDPCQNGGTCNNYYDYYTCTCPAHFLGATCEDASSICYATGDPHYLTFDQVWHNFQGDCQYTLVQECQDGISSPFQIDVTNVDKELSTYGSYTYEVSVQVFGTEVTLRQDREVFINGRRVTLPAEPISGLVISLSGFYVEVSADVQQDDQSVYFFVKWDGERTVEVRLPFAQYENVTCGLCGNFNGNQTDEYLTPDGQLVSDVQEFGNSWALNPGSCDPLNPGDNVCNETSSEYSMAVQACQMIQDNSGPFQRCFDTLDPTPFFDACVMDGCLVPPSQLSETTCHIIELFAQACLDREAVIEYWRNESFCPVACPQDLTYDWCTSACPMTCYDVIQGESPSCDTPCVEGCTCPDGLVFDGFNCVNTSSCGCYVDGIYYSIGDTIYTPGCFSKRTCQGNNAIEDIPQTCSDFATCGIQDGEHGCHCLAGYEGNGIDCQDIDECASSPCINGECVNDLNFYACNCDMGWSGYNCNEACVENPCMNGGTCFSSNSTTLECQCPFPFNGTFCEINNDPCTMADNPCQNGGTCNSFGLQYNCTCAYGFQGSNCEEEINPCNDLPCQNGGTCTNLIETYTCRCGGSFMGRNCEIEYAICYAAGDPHYTTFDGLKHDFQGDCSYVFARDCLQTDPTFSVVVSNRKRSPTAAVSFTYDVTVTLNQSVIYLGPSRAVTLDGVVVDLPTERSGVRISLSGIYVQVVADIGLYVRWDGNSRVEVKVTADYKNQTCGLCGNYNGIGTQEDEFITPAGNSVSNEAAFGNSWEAYNDPACQPQGDEVNPCLSASEDVVLEAQRKCGLIMEEPGPFMDCFAELDPNPFFRDCVYDACATDVDDALCNAMASFDQACRYFYIDMPSWRNATLCPLPCQMNSTYSSCTSACPATCWDYRDADRTCDDLCVEGCSCDEGFVLEGLDCVPESQCGCVADGFYLPVGSLLLTPDCSQYCECNQGGNLNCTEVACDPNAQCDVVDGETRCVCNPGYDTVGFGFTCLDINECEGDPCVNGTCINGENQFTCDCNPGWVGDLCDDRDDCFTQPCRNGAPCIDGMDTFTCSCLQGWMGSLCDIDIDECADQPCDHDGVCEDLVGGYRCNCTNGWEGDNCELEINECASYPCVNGGTCFDFVGYFRCSCTTSFSGDRCEIDISPCSTDPCENGATCVGFGIGQYSCECVEGFFGKDCQINANDCFNEPCENGGTCKDLVNAYECECVIGFAGVNCEQDDRPEIEIVRIWNNAITVYWVVLIEVDWFRFEYQLSGASDWTSVELDGDRRLYSILDLMDETDYRVQIVMRRTESGTVATTEAVTVTTCAQGFSGENCTDDARDMPFNLQIQTARTTSLTVTWEATFTPPTLNLIQFQYRVYRTTTWLMGPTISNVSLGIADIPSLRGREYYDVRIIVTNLNTSVSTTSLGNRFYTCMPNRIGPNCEYEYQICTVWGDPHYITFDGVSYDYQGECDYTLVTDVCEDSTPSVLPSFHLWSDNVKRRPSDSVSYLRELLLDYEGTVYAIEREHVVTVDGVRITLPYQSQDGSIYIFYTGAHTFISTEFGLRVQYDGRYRAEITLPETYRNHTCGLCGTYDGLRDNDYTRPDGRVVTSAVLFANSWSGSECTSPGDLVDPCSDDATRTSASTQCSILSDEDGMLGDCFSYVDPSSYFLACVYDLCATLPEDDLLCEDVDAYASACREAGGSPGNWRSELTQCELSCPEGMTLSSCASGCPLSCAEPSGRPDCPVSCIEACVCNDGLIWDGLACVAPEDCGCLLPSGEYLSSGESSISANCSQQCSCSGGTVSCEPLSCDPNEECAIKGGVRDCYCRENYQREGEVCVRAPGRCTVRGDPHYITFDRRRFDFQGDCEYTLVRPCNSSDPSVADFHLWGNNVKNQPSARVSFLRGITLEFNGTSYSIRQGNAVYVNGIRSAGSYFSTGSDVVIEWSSQYAFVTTSFGLSFSYDGRHIAEIDLDYSYLGKTCGLCGTFDEDSDNDFHVQDGSQTQFLTVFANSWVVNPESCNGESPQPGECTGDLLEEALDVCYIFSHPDGPLSDCFDFVYPRDTYEDCLYDYCAIGPVFDVCDYIQEYVSSCYQEGVDLGDWRSEVSECAITCSGNKVYQTGASACQPTCSVQTPPADCPWPPYDRCVCPEGLLEDGDRCVGPADCGCTYTYGEESLYIEAGTVWVSDSCDRRCACDAGSLTCMDMSCGDFEECVIKGGVRDCYCVNRFVREEGTCVRAPGICTVWGDPHYTMFDGGRHDFQGDCEYTLVRPCSDRADLVDFHLWGDNVKNNPSDRVSFLRKVVLEVNGTSYSIERNRVVLVNGARRSTPLNLNNGITIRSDWSYATIETSFGLSVRYDGGSTATIEVSYEYWNATCGLCGTFDDDRSNDFRLRDGSVTPYENVFGNDWVLNGGECDTTVPLPVDGCDDPDVRQLVEDICYIFINPDGPLAGCLDFVDVSDYYDACIFDLCFTDPGNNIICSALQEYVQKCRGETNNIIGDWRASVAQCPFECPSGTVYESCGSACQSSCTDPDADLNCGLPCRETCSCPEGLLDDGGTCVQPEDCGCTLPDGGYISAGDVYVNDDCSEMCSCSGGTLECVAYACVENQECRIKGGVRDCYCRDGFTYSNGECTRAPGICTVWGDPHYTMFDGGRHDFQGDCEYTLVRPCSDRADLVDFHLWGDNIKNNPSDRVSYLRKVVLEVNGTSYSIERNRVVLVNGARRTTPLSFINGVTIRSDRSYAVKE